MEAGAQNTVLKSVELLPESIPKKLSAPPQQAFPILVTQNNNLSTRFELPGGDVHYLKWLEPSYDVQLVDSATGNPLLAGGGGDFNYVLPARYLSEFMTFEIYPSSSTTKFSYIPQADYYSKMSTMAYLDHRKRDKSQRFVFSPGRSEVLGATMDTADPALEVIPGAPTVATQTIDAVPNEPANYIMLKRRGLAPPKHKFCYRLSDAYQDCYINEDTGTYSAVNIVCIFSWNNLTKMIAQIGTGDGRDATTILQTMSQNGIALKIDNFKLNYYIESNPELKNFIKNQTNTILVPYIIQNNTSQTGIQNGCTVTTDMEPGNRIYKVYASLFTNSFSSAGGAVGYQNGWTAQNNSNVDRNPDGDANYEKWGGIELYMQNDLIAKYELATFNDYKAYLFNKFKDSCFDSKNAIENFGTFIYIFDSDKHSGRKNEYDRRQLKGKSIADKTLNINPRFLDVRTMRGADNVGANDFNPTRSYTNQVFGVILRRMINNKGVFSSA